MRRLALTGAHGTGKTTLIGLLPDKLSPLGGVAVCREAPRLIADAVGNPEFFRRGNNTPARQGLIFLQHLVEERQQSRNCDILITDRTLVDHLAYTTVLFPEISNSDEFEIYRRAAFETLKDYELIFKLPIEFTAIDDGVREADPAFQVQIDAVIDRLYTEAGVSTKILSGSVNERLSAAFAAIAPQHAGSSPE